MSARPFDFPAAFARLWIDSSLQMMRATSDVWTSLLAPASARPTSSTASPWWMPPQSPRFATPTAAAPWPSPFAFGTWSPPWLAAPGLPAVTTSPAFPWPMNLPTASTSNPFAIWQQMWLEAAASPLGLPHQATAAPARTEIWQPLAAAYRTANGHAMAAVLRTMADVVEPKPSSLTPALYWPASLGTRH